VTRQELDIANASAVSAALERYRPWAVVNAAGYVRVDDAETDAKRCFRENATGPAVLAKFCARDTVALVTFSTDLVFDGKQETPYLETDEVRPLSVYGKSKVRAEALVQERYPGALIIRTSAFFGPWDRFNFVASALRSLRSGRPLLVSNDTTISPTYVPDLVHTCLDLLIDDEAGIWHLTNGHALTWEDLALRVAAIAQIDPSALRSCGHERLRLRAPRPIYSALRSSRSFAMPSLDDALRRFNCQAEMPAA
jgi:dTDP-4-dehydrorhamnose reductase